MSKQLELVDVAALTDWQKVYERASETDRKIVDFVAANPGALRGDIVAGTGISGKTIDFRLWELAGRSTGGHAADGLLIGNDHGGRWRYYARDR